jgi:hypothetical protein
LLSRSLLLSIPTPDREQLHIATTTIPQDRYRFFRFSTAKEHVPINLKRFSLAVPFAFSLPNARLGTVSLLQYGQAEVVSQQDYSSEELLLSTRAEVGHTIVLKQQQQQQVRRMRTHAQAKPPPTLVCRVWHVLLPPSPTTTAHVPPLITSFLCGSCVSTADCEYWRGRVKRKNNAHNVQQ